MVFLEWWNVLARWKSEFLWSRKDELTFVAGKEEGTSQIHVYLHVDVIKIENVFLIYNPNYIYDKHYMLDFIVMQVSIVNSEKWQITVIITL